MAKNNDKNISTANYNNMNKNHKSSKNSDVKLDISFKDNAKWEQADDIMDTSSVASTMECTGMIQRPPESEDEAQNYYDIYHIPQVTDARKGMTGPDEQ